MTNHNQHPKKDPHEGLPTDERFKELTGGLGREDVHPFLVDMRDFGSCGVRFGDDVVTLRPDNLENGAMFPVVIITGSGAVTTIRSFPGDKLAFELGQLSEDMDGIGLLEGELDTHPGAAIRSESDFLLIPKTHWKAIGIACTEIAEQKQAQAERKATKRGRGLLRQVFGRKY